MASPTPTVAIPPGLKNACHKMGEGPHWDAATQTLYFVDIPGHQVHRYNSATHQHDFKQLDDAVTPVIPRQGGGLMIGLGRRFAQLDWATGKTSVVAEVEPGTNNRFNDGKCDARGRLWAGTMSSAPGAASLYTLDLDRTVRTQHSGMTISNGLAWTGDNRTFFLVDSTPGNLYAFDFNLNTGTIDSERTVRGQWAEFGIPSGSVPDGMTIDTDDKLWIAFFNGGAVLKIDPETGKMLQKVDLPSKQTTSVSWGGQHLNEMYVTTGRAGFSSQEIHDDPQSGSVYRITGLGARGRPANNYQG